MGRLVMDEISEKTLPFLDGLNTTDKDKLYSIIVSTPVEQLRRLFKASIARQNVLGRGMTGSNAADLVEVLIHNNIHSAPGDNNEEEFDETIAVISDKGSLETLLLISILRFNALKNRS